VHPILIDLPALGLAIPAYNTLLFLAVAVCFSLGPRWLMALEGIEPGRSRRALLWLGLAVFAGARLHYVANQWEDFADRPRAALAVWSGGLHAGGGIIALALTAPLILPRLGLPAGAFADGLIPTAGIGIAIARLGCFLHGCCFGSTCTWPWCVSFPHETYIHTFHASLGLLPPDAARTLAIHPLQLYFAAAGLGLTALALWLHPRRRYAGQVALVALVLHSASAAALEFLRADYHPRIYWGPLPQLEWVALAMTAGAVGALAVAEIVNAGSPAPARHGGRPAAGREGAPPAGPPP
jgi:phosphatidylglycerol:prolipoprotein diacylglycerol transferase